MAPYSELEHTPYGMKVLTVESFAKPLSRFSDCSVFAQENDLEKWMGHYEAVIGRDAGIQQLEIVTNGAVEISGRGFVGNFRANYKPDAGPVPTRVVDVQTREVREYAGEKYAIASYVWRQWEIENVVEIACEMAKRHGIPSVWIDTKCIYQGDDEASMLDKERQIPLMGDYYAGATVTYVLVPKIYYEIYVRSLDRDIIFCPANTVGWEKITRALLDSVWMRRVWTAQEAYRSKNAVCLMEGGIIQASSLALVATIRIERRKFGISNWYPEGDCVLISGSFIGGDRVRDATGFSTLHRFRSDEDLKDFTAMWDQNTSREATIEIDRIYGLLGMTSVGKMVPISYNTTIEEKIKELAANGLLSMASLLTENVSESENMSWWGSRIKADQAEFDTLSQERLSSAENGMPTVFGTLISIKEDNIRPGGVTVREGSYVYTGKDMEDADVEIGDYLAIGISSHTKTCFVPGITTESDIWLRNGRARVLLNVQGTIEPLGDMKMWHIG